MRLHLSKAITALATAFALGIPLAADALDPPRDPGAPLIATSTIWVRDTWTVQADVDADATVGPAGCAGLAITPAFGTNAFNNIAAAVAAVDPAGTVNILNGAYLEDEVGVIKAMSIVGYDEATCGSGLTGRTGVTVGPSVSDTTHAIFEVKAYGVQIRDMAIDGDDAGTLAPCDSGFGIRFDDLLGAASATPTSFLNLDIANFATCGIRMATVGSSGLLIEGCNVSNVGDVLSGGDNTGAAVDILGTHGTAQFNTVTNCTSGIRFAGGGIAGFPPMSGSGVQPVFSVNDNTFATMGSASSTGFGCVDVGFAARGNVDRNSVTDARLGIVVEQHTNAQILVNNTSLGGTIEVGVLVDKVAAPPLSIIPASVDVAFTDGVFSCTDAAIRVLAVGQGGNQFGQATVRASDLAISAGTLTSVGFHVWNVDPVAGTVLFDNNSFQDVNVGEVDGFVATNQFQSVMAETSNVSLSRNFTIDCRRALIVESIDSAPGVPGDITSVSTLAPSNPFGSSEVSGILVTGLAANALVTNADIDQTTTGAIAPGVHVTAGGTLMMNSSFLHDCTTSVLVDSGSFAQVNTTTFDPRGDATASTHVLVQPGGTVQLGDALVIGSGGNTFRMRAGDVGVSNRGATGQKAENNFWVFAGTPLSAPGAVDDFIRDGDADNTSLAGELGTRTVDFIPFAGAVLAGTVTVIPTSTPATPGYGAFIFRKLSDGLFAVGPGGTVFLVAGTFDNRYYADDSTYSLTTLHVDKEMTLQGVTAATTTIYPAVDGPGSLAGPSVLEPGSTSLFLVSTGNVFFNDLGMNGDNPAFFGFVSFNGADINARNAIAFDRAGAIDTVFVTRCSVRNFLFSGVASPPGPGMLNNVQVITGAFDNAGAASTSNAAASVRLVQLTNSYVFGSTFAHTRRAVFIDAMDSTSLHRVQSNTITAPLETGVEVADFAAGASLDVSSNNFALATGTNGLVVRDITAGAAANIELNSFDSGGLQAVLDSIDGDSTVVVQTNTFNAVSGPPATAGLCVHACDNATTGTGVFVDHNMFMHNQTGALVQSLLGGVNPAGSRGVYFRGNMFTYHLGHGMLVLDNDGDPTTELDVRAGSTVPSDTNTFWANNIGVRVSGPGAHLRIEGRAPQPHFDNNIDGILAEDGAALHSLGNRFVRGPYSGIHLSGAGTQCLMEDTHFISSVLVGVRIEPDARCEMGPGSLANQVTNAFFGGLHSPGRNIFRNFTGTAGNFAIENTSPLDQNAENNDFSVSDCAIIEGLVEHQVDNPGYGLVDFCPPRVPFTNLPDAFILDTE